MNTYTKILKQLKDNAKEVPLHELLKPYYLSINYISFIVFIEENEFKNDLFLQNLHILLKTINELYENLYLEDFCNKNLIKYQILKYLILNKKDLKDLKDLKDFKNSKDFKNLMNYLNQVYPFIFDK